MERARILVQVQPDARKNEITGFREGVLHIRIAAPPVKGKANQELIAFMASLLGISKGDLAIEKGLTSKKKVISIVGLTQEQVVEHLENLDT